MTSPHRWLTMVTLLVVASLLLVACDSDHQPQTGAATPSPALPTFAPGSLSDAATIVNRASQAVNAPLFQSVALTYTMRISDQGVNDQARLWYLTPNRWRLQNHYRLVINPGPSPLQVSDGTTFWRYDPASSLVNIANVSDVLGGNEQPLYSLASTFKPAACPAPRLLGQDTVAGRPAYVVELGSDQCVQAPRPGMDRWVVWIDQQTFLELKSQGSRHSPLPSIGANASPPLTITREITAIAYNLPLDPALFQFTPPANAKLMDQRALPLAEVRRRLSFPVFISTAMPDRLHAELPYLRDNAGDPPSVEIFYHTADGRVVLDITDRASSPDDRFILSGGETVTLASGIVAHLSIPRPQCWPENSMTFLGWEQDGTLITMHAEQYGMGGAALQRDELLTIAASMSRTADLATAPRPALTPALPSPLPTTADCDNYLPIPQPSYEPQTAPLPTSTPPPTANSDQMTALLATWASQADYPIFVPSYIPDGFYRDHRGDQFAPNGSLSLRYAAAIALNTPPDQLGSNFDLMIDEHAASYTQIAGGLGESVALAAGRGGLWRNVPNLDGSPSLINVLRDGVLIRISSSILSPADLIKVANSLTAVPGGHAPLPDPTPFTLAEVRAQLPIPVFVPTDLPADFIAEPPVVGNDSIPGMGNYSRPTTAVTLAYHHHDGRPALWVHNSLVNITYSGSQPDHPTLPNGSVANFVNRSVNEGGPTLLWQQEGVYLTISGPEQTRDSLLRIAASMSATADPATEELDTRPAPTPALPSFTLLHPQWLPDPNMSETQQADPNSPQAGGNITLIFDDQPTDPQPHVPLTLREIQRGIYAGGLPDPRAQRETIGNQSVWVSRTGDSCTQMSWTQGNVDLTLKNAYNLQARPRYSCDQLRQIVASIRLGWPGYRPSPGWHSSNVAPQRSTHLTNGTKSGILPTYHIQTPWPFAAHH